MKKYGLMIISFTLVLTAIPMAPALISRNSTSAPNAAPPSPTGNPEKTVQTSMKLYSCLMSQQEMC